MMRRDAPKCTAMTGRRKFAASQWSTGLLLILLIVGGDAARDQMAFEEESFSAHTKRAFGKAAAAKRAERMEQSHEKQGTEAELAAELLMGLRLEAKAGTSVEVARGWLAYKGRPMHAVLRKDESEPGAGILMLYNIDDLNISVNFEMVDAPAITAEPFRSLQVRSDDAAGIEKLKDGNKLKIRGEKRYSDARNMEVAGAMKTMHFSPVADRNSVLLAGDNRWLQVETADQTVEVWMNAVRMLQSVGTCLEDGSCLMQCTYLEESATCNFPAFCTLKKHGWFSGPPRDRCVPKTTHKENMDGWKSFQDDVVSKSKWVYRTGCLALCKSSWDDVIHGVNLGAELKKQYHSAADTPGMMENMNTDTATVLKEIADDVQSWVDVVADNMGVGFDFGRKIPWGATRALLKQKGCADLPAGSMKALLLMSVAPDNTSLREHFKVYEDSCSWFKELTNGEGGEKEKSDEEDDHDEPDVASFLNRTEMANGTDDSAVDRVNKNCFSEVATDLSFDDCTSRCGDNCGAVIYKNDSKKCWTSLAMKTHESCHDESNNMHTFIKDVPDNSNTSLIQNGTSSSFIPLMSVLVVSAVVAGSIMILSGVALVIKGAMCKKDVPASTNNLAHEHCKSKLDVGSPCWSSRMLPGIYMMISGVVVIALTAVAVWAVGPGAALIPGMYEYVVAGAATAGGGAALTGLYTQLRSWFVKEKDTDPDMEVENAYVECMKLMKDTMADLQIDTPAIAQGPKVETVDGAEELFDKAKVPDKLKVELRKDLLGLGVVSISELTAEDWEDLPSVKTMGKFVKKRLLANVAAP